LPENKTALMALSEESSEVSHKEQGRFQQTHWNEVLLAGKGGTPAAAAALAGLCQAYWYPLYVFIRRQGHSHQDAEDLVQGFFAKVLEKNYLRDAKQEKGRFRSFLLTALKRYMANEWDRARRAKRGGGRPVISLDGSDTEIRYRSEPADTMSPEKAYQRTWTMTLLARVLQKLREEFEAAGKGELFRELEFFIAGEKSDATYAQIGQNCGVSEGVVKVTVHRLRHRYLVLLRQEILQTVESPQSVDEELRDLLGGGE
jgi:RNA polymerase sigma factor (sigma-70 family)